MIGSKSYTGLTRAAASFRAKGRGLRRDESGSALVEFAFSAVLLMTMLFGIIEFGFALYTYQFVNEVAREMSRYAIVRGSQCTAMPNCGYTDATSTAQAYARAAYNYPGMDMTKLTVTNTWYSPVKNSDGTIKTWSACAGGTGCNKPGYMVQVNVSYPFILNIPFVPSTNMSVSSSSSMVISQ
jgi:Flp pilus assembly protein TadG